MNGEEIVRQVPKIRTENEKPHSPKIDNSSLELIEGYSPINFAILSFAM